MSCTGCRLDLPDIGSGWDHLLLTRALLISGQSGPNRQNEAVRGTVDIDLAIAWNRKNLVTAEKALHQVGLVFRLPVTADDIFNFRKEYIEQG